MVLCSASIRDWAPLNQVPKSQSCILFLNTPPAASYMLTIRPLSETKALNSTTSTSIYTDTQGMRSSAPASPQPRHCSPACRWDSNAMAENYLLPPQEHSSVSSTRRCHQFQPESLSSHTGLAELIICNQALLMLLAICRNSFSDSTNKALPVA